MHYRTRTLARLFLAALLWLVAAVASAGHDQGLLWKIEREGVTPSHIFGTIHSDDVRVLRIPDPVDEVFQTSERYLFEIDFNAEDMQATVMRMFFVDGRRLSNKLSDESWERLVKASADTALPEHVLDSLKPWALATILTVPQSDPDQMLDKQLYDRAIETGRPVDGLETGDEQLAIFDDLPLARQIEYLEGAVEYVETGEADALFQELVDRYLERDLAGLMALAEAHPVLPGEDANASITRRLVDDRNRIMMTRMRNDLERGGAFIAVGALHLPGENGLLALLEQRGYNVTAVY